MPYNSDCDVYNWQYDPAYLETIISVRTSYFIVLLSTIKVTNIKQLLDGMLETGLIHKY